MHEQGRWLKIEPQGKNIIVWGAADQCRVNYPILKSLGYTIGLLVDDTPEVESPIKGVPLCKGLDGLDDHLMNFKNVDFSYVIAIGNPHGQSRIRLQHIMSGKGFSPISFADPTALICKSVLYGNGLQVMPGVVIHNDVRIGEQCIINTRSLVEHDCRLGKGVEIGPGAVLCGRVNIGDYTWVGANATIRQRINIGRNSIVGAGSVVVKDIPDNVIVAGVPAKIIKDNIGYE
jgi:sugar O-acyltransferase (sialic acid O-acetyltransferase NeuD family)